MKRLPQFREVSLETSPITDAELAHLKELPYLEKVNLKWTKVTDAGVAEFEKGLPKVNVER